jgi:hypothetical protein
LTTAGCAGLPLFRILPDPQPGADSFLIIPVQLENDVSEPPFGKYRLRIINESNPKYVRTTIINPLDRYTYVPRMPAGTYKIVEQEFVYDSGKFGRKSSLDMTFVLEPNCITISHKQFICRLFRKSGEKVSTMNYSWEALTERMAKQTLERLSKEPNFQMWRLSESTKKNPVVKEALLELGFGEYLN